MENGTADANTGSQPGSYILEMRMTAYNADQSYGGCGGGEALSSNALELLSPDQLLQTPSAHALNLVPVDNTAETASTRARLALLQRAHSTLSPLLSQVPLLRSVELPLDCSHLPQGPALMLGVFHKSVSCGLLLGCALKRNRLSLRYCPKSLLSFSVLHHPNPLVLPQGLAPRASFWSSLTTPLPQGLLHGQRPTESVTTTLSSLFLFVLFSISLSGSPTLRFALHLSPNGTVQDQLRPIEKPRSVSLPRSPDHQELQDPSSYK
eukprot:IDg21076t1